VALSRLKRGFESRWGRQPSLWCSEGCPAEALRAKAGYPDGEELRLGKPASSMQRRLPRRSALREGGLPLMEKSFG
jgi:hypothetical protein